MLPSLTPGQYFGMNNLNFDRDLRYSMGVLAKDICKVLILKRSDI